MNPGKCGKCNEKVNERCSGDFCKECHISITWESCLDDTWSDDLRRSRGLKTVKERSES